MRLLVIGAGGVGSAMVSIAARRNVFEEIVVADVDGDRAARAATQANATAGHDRVRSAKVDASFRVQLVELARSTRADVIVNACDPRFNPPIFEAAFAAGCHYLDMAMNLSVPHPTDPYNTPGVMLGEAQWAAASPVSYTHLTLPTIYSV